MSDLLVTHLRKEYPTRSEPLVVLRDVNLNLSRGQNVAILGPSGTGKSTLLYILGTLETATAGNYELLGQTPSQLSEPELAKFRHQQIGFVFQEHYLLPQCSALENILLPSVASGGSTPALRERALQLLQRVGLADRAQHRPAELSGGERQRVAIARGLLMKPALLLADEPTGNLDRHHAQSIGELLLELQKTEQTMLIAVTHSIEFAALFERQMELNQGQLLTLG
jgi:lipoprotein-releasing system ATP-binding protein